MRKVKNKAKKEEEEERGEEEEEQYKWASILEEGEEGEEEEEEDSTDDERFQLPEINAEDIVATTTTLLRRLESERTKLEARLRQEHQLIVGLQKEIDVLMIQVGF